jgi:hypothetical protein
VLLELEPSGGFEAALIAERIPKRGQRGEEVRAATMEDAVRLAAARGVTLP